MRFGSAAAMTTQPAHRCGAGRGVEPISWFISALALPRASLFKKLATVRPGSCWVTDDGVRSRIGNRKWDSHLYYPRRTAEWRGGDGRPGRIIWRRQGITDRRDAHFSRWLVTVVAGVMSGGRTVAVLSLNRRGGG